MFVPGAASSTSALCVEDGARTSEEVVLATEITSGNAAGYSSWVPPVFPAAATISAPAVDAFCTAPWSSSGRSVTSDMLMILTWFPTSQLMQAATLESGPEPFESSALHTQIGLSNDTPATPTPLLVSAAAVPATCAPWPIPPLQPARTSPLDSSMWTQPLILFWNSVWVVSMPVSTKPILIPPVAGNDPMPAKVHPSVASMSASARPPPAPVFLNAYCCANLGSFGVAATRAMPSGAAHATPGVARSVATASGTDEPAGSRTMTVGSPSPVPLGTPRTPPSAACCVLLPAAR